MQDPDIGHQIPIEQWDAMPHAELKAEPIPDGAPQLDVMKEFLEDARKKDL